MAVVVAILGSCGTQPTVHEDAPREGGRAEGATSGGAIASTEEGADGEKTAEPTASTTVAEPDPEPAPGPASANTPTSPAVGTNGMVSSAHPLATRAGLDVLADGGNAFDAAVAVGAALGVVEPMMSGVGGYGAMVVYDAQSGETRFLNASSRVPATLNPAVFRPPTPGYEENRRSARAISTPGMANAWETLHEEYGDLEWRRLFEPAIGYAEEGFVVDGENANWIQTEFYAFPPHAQEIYGDAGVPLRAGERLVQRDLARSLRLLSEQGAGVVYEGELAGAMAAEAQEQGGFLTTDDLRANRAEWLEPISVPYRGNEVVTASPPLTSWGALVRLGIMGQFDLDPQDHNTAAYLDAYAQVTEMAYRERLDYVRDPEVEPTPLDLLLSEGYWADQAARVNAQAAAPSAPSPAYLSNRQEHTTHFVVADGEGNVVSATQTLGNLFGSRVMPEGTGIWLNDSIAFATFEPAGNPLDVFPGRYRLVGIAPILVQRDGRPVVALGTQGGFNIQQTTPQMLVNLLDFGMDIQRAIAAPRISFVEPDWLAVEAGIPQPILDALAASGHNPYVEELGLGNAHGLTVEYDPEGRPVRFTGGADPRAEGAAIGY